MTSKNGFSTNAFLEFAHKEKNNLFYEVRSGEVLGLIFEHGKSDTFLKGTSICYTPIGFSGARSINTADLTLLINNNPNIAAGFIQSRSLLPNDKLGLGFQELNWGCVLSEFRTNYRIPLTTEISLAAMKKDTRARIKKIQKHEAWFEFGSANSAEEIKAFSLMYHDTAKRAGFSKQYMFSELQWQKLLIDPNWQLYLLRYQNQIVAGCVVTDVEDGVDYTYMAYKLSNMDFSRALLWYLHKFLVSNKQGYLYLGGGIEEGDSLARFKLSFGAEEVYCLRYKFAVSKNLNKDLTLPIIKSKMLERWPV